jgi:general secretion pathway protein D
MKTPNGSLPLAAMLLALTLYVYGRTAHAAEPVLPPPIPPLGFAAPASVPVNMSLGAQFSQGMRIQEFARVVLVDVLKAQFVFSSDFLLSQAQVGFSARDLKRKGTEALLQDVLSEHGFTVELRGGYYRVAATRPQDRKDTREDFVYRLKHRDLGYISSQIQPLFSPGSFTHQRAADTSSSQRSTSTHTGGSGSARPTDTGTSMYSMTTRTDSDILFFRGEPSEISRLKTVLAAIDTPIPKVVLRAFVLETSSGSQEGYSVSAVAKLLGSRLGVTVGSSALGGGSLSFQTGDFEAVATALKGDASVRVLTAPSLFAENGVPASVIVGNSVPVLGSIQTNANGQSTQSIENVDTGVILRFTPRILENSIGIQLEQELSDAIQTETGVRGSPTITKRSIRTSLNMRSGEWVILGGVSSQKSSSNRDSLPFWRNITLGKTTSNSSSDIVIVLYVEKS